MKTSPAYPERLHFDPTHPCCETSASAKLFPELLNVNTNCRHRGHITTVFLESRGIGITDRKVTIDPVAWAECVKSPNFQSYYEVSMAKMRLEQALANRN